LFSLRCQGEAEENGRRGNKRAVAADVMKIIAEDV
jgi:hypothetical protein